VLLADALKHPARFIAAPEPQALAAAIVALSGVSI
jgi:hypothetical protein